MSEPRFVIGISGAHESEETTMGILPWWVDRGLILTMQPDMYIPVNEENPVALKVTGWKDHDFGENDDWIDYPIEVELYRPGKEPFGVIWKCIISRSNLKSKPEIVYSTPTSGVLSHDSIKLL